jgi:hypothetical protein
VELCHRKHGKLVLAVSFNLCILNDQNNLTISPVVKYATGMDVVLKTRALNHLKKMLAKHYAMSGAFTLLAGGFFSSLSDSEGEWVPPRSDLSLLGLPHPTTHKSASDSGADPDSEEDSKILNAVKESKRHRAEGSDKWRGKLR